VLKIQFGNRSQLYRKIASINVISFGHKHLALDNRVAENVFWANVSLGNRLSGQMSFFWLKIDHIPALNVKKGKQPPK
jgi:hypothetical protein